MKINKRTVNNLKKINDLKTITNFKSHFLKQVREIKILKERVQFSVHQLEYDMKEGIKEEFEEMAKFPWQTVDTKKMR